MKCHYPFCENGAQRNRTTCNEHWFHGIPIEKHRLTQLRYGCICDTCRQAGNDLRVHPTITPERVCSAVRSGRTTGFCTHCGIGGQPIKYAAKGGRCEQCGYYRVIAAEALLFYV